MPVYGDYVTAFGEKKRIAEWSKETGIPFHTLYDRIRKRHWDPERALTQPRKQNRTVTIGDVSLPLYRWTERTGINYKTAQARLDKGWEPYDALYKDPMSEKSTDSIRHTLRPSSGYRPKECVYPACEHCPYSDCICP